MHSQSDFGYAIPQIESRTRAVCAQRAWVSLGLSKQCVLEGERDAWRARARAWIEEGKMIQKVRKCSAEVYVTSKDDVWIFRRTKHVTQHVCEDADNWLITFPDGSQAWGSAATGKVHWRAGPV